MNRRLSMLVAAAFLTMSGAATLAAPEQAQSPQAPALPAALPDFDVTAGGAWQVGPMIVSGQPSEAALRSLKDRGVTAVICLRSARELADRKAVPYDEPALARELGLEFIHVPLAASWSYTPGALSRVDEAIRRHDGKVLLHCTVGGRASIAWTAHRMRFGGEPIEDAMAQGREMALGTELLENFLGRKIEYRVTDEAKEPEKGWLVDAAWLADTADDRTIRRLDARQNYIEYLKGHLAGAVHLDPHALRGSSGGMPAQLRTPERMAEVFALAGVSPFNRTVVYAEGNDILSATLAIYALERMGHVNTALVDGGVDAVRAAGLVSQDYPAALKPGTFDPLDNSRIGVTLEQVTAMVERGPAAEDAPLFVDARPPEQFAGETAVWRRNGHIPGAVNVWWRDLTASENASALRPRDEIRQRFEAAGVRPERDIIVYCGTGREASLLYLYLTRELGYPRVRLFEGGWTQYASSDTLPVER